MNLIAELEAEQIASLGKTIPDFKAGDTIRVGYKVTEGTRSRVQNYEGVVIGRKGGATISASFSKITICSIRSLCGKIFYCRLRWRKRSLRKLKSASRKSRRRSAFQICSINTRIKFQGDRSSGQRRAGRSSRIRK